MIWKTNRERQMNLETDGVKLAGDGRAVRLWWWQEWVLMNMVIDDVGCGMCRIKCEWTQDVQPRQNKDFLALHVETCWTSTYSNKTYAAKLERVLGGANLKFKIVSRRSQLIITRVDIHYPLPSSSFFASTTGMVPSTNWWLAKVALFIVHSPIPFDSAVSLLVAVHISLHHVSNILFLYKYKNECIILMDHININYQTFICRSNA
jgi:hypothetical protein